MTSPLRFSLLLLVACLISGCVSSDNVLAKFRSVTIPAHGRVAVARHLPGGKSHMAYETPGRVIFTMLTRYGVEDQLPATWGANGEIGPANPGMCVFEFVNPTNRPVLVIFPRDGGSHGRITEEQALEILRDGKLRRS